MYSMQFCLFVGILTSSGIEGIGFFKSENQPLNESFPYIQLQMRATLPHAFDNKEKQDYKLKKINMIPKVRKYIKILQ